MPFSFLNPWFWLAALAVAAPIWLHLRRKEPRDLVRFTALRFLDDQPLAPPGPAHLRNLVLFALRLLALLVLVAAFCWPFAGYVPPPVVESRVYLLDNTLSHQANSAFSRDLKRVLAELSQAEPSVQIAVIELTSAPRVVVPFGDDREAARQKVNQLHPSYQRGSYLAAFRMANSLLINSLGSRKRIVFLGDNQENQWTENINAPPFLRQVEVEMPKPAAPTLPNVSLSDPRAQRIFLGDKSLVNFTVKLAHLGEAKTANLVLQANDQVVVNRSVDLDAQPRTLILQAQWEADPDTWLRGQVSVEAQPDALEGDNRVFFSLPPVLEGKVALLAQSPFLRLALSPEVMRGQWAARILEPAQLAAEVKAGQDADVLCLESNFLQSSDARTLLSRYLASGRGAILLVNRLTPTIRGCLRELGFEAEGTVDAGPDSQERFQFVLSNHPILHPFLSPDFGNLMEIRLFKYASIKSSQALPLISSRTGAGLFFQAQPSSGKLFVAAFGLDREHTTWPIHQSFIPFLDLALQAARAEDPMPSTFEPGDTTLLRLPPGSKVREVALRDPQAERGRWPVEDGRVQLRLPDRPGLFALTYDNRVQAERFLSVNPSPKESELAYVEAPAALDAWKVDSTASRPASAVAATRALRSSILRQRWWWWMLMAGLTLLLVEMGIISVRKERA